MAQNFGMIANYAEKAKNTNTEGAKLLEDTLRSLRRRNHEQEHQEKIEMQKKKGRP
jgi:hypothetical protein